MKKKYFYFMSDVDSAIGNFSEVLFYALLKARRNKSAFILVRKIVFLSFILSKRLGYRQPKALYRIRTDNIVNLPIQKYILGVFWGSCVFFSYLYEAIKYKLCKVTMIFFKKTYTQCKFNPKVPSLGSKDLFNINLKKSFSFSDEDKYYWKKALSSKFNVLLDPKDQIILKRSYSKLSLDKYPWYVCLHIRTPFYYNSTNDLFRNSNIENYYEAIKYIVSLGGAVVRMGDPMDNILQIDGFIDYPNTFEKSEAMDLYLIKNCKFFIGTNSGIIDTAFLFGVPVLGVNITSFLYISPYKECDSFIYKHIYSIDKGSVLSFEEALEEPFIINSNLLTSYELNEFHSKYQFVENTSNEILSATRNMYKRLMMNSYIKNDFQLVFEQHIQKTGIKWIESEAYFQDFLDGQYRCASKLFFNGCIDSDFASKNYYKSL